MKKSSAYYLAQLSVLRDKALDEGTQLSVLRFLMDAEDVARYCEKDAEKKATEDKEEA